MEPFQPSVRTEGGLAVPPLWKMFDGPRDKRLFLRNSLEVLELYKRYGGIRSDSKMLDIGSGLGRKTLALTGFIGPDGHYNGVDITREGIDWCNKNISSKYPNFQFTHLDVFNARYNRAATVAASEYRFSFADETFDLITAWSVFTHMLPADVRNYLRETCRMLKPNGRCMFSFYVMTDDAFEAVRNGIATEKIEYELADGLFTDNKNVPEDLTAFRESWIRAEYAACGLAVDEVLFGSWRGDGRQRSFPMSNYQDIVVARRA